MLKLNLSHLLLVQIVVELVLSKHLVRGEDGVMRLQVAASHLRRHSYVGLNGQLVVREKVRAREQVRAVELVDVLKGKSCC